MTLISHRTGTEGTKRAGFDPATPNDRSEHPRRNPVTLIPHILTTANLAAGFFAIVRSAQGNLDQAVIAIWLAMACDLLDGRVARAQGVATRFGAEYDSVADTVSFGVAPALLTFHFGKLSDLGWSGWVVAFAYVVCAGLRLARFNVSAGRYKNRFQGLPSPAAAGMVATTAWFAGTLQEAGIETNVPAYVIGIGLVTLALLMVSGIPYRTGKEISLQSSNRFLTFAAICFVAILAKPSVTLFVIGSAYVLLGPIELWWRPRFGKALEEADAPPVA